MLYLILLLFDDAVEAIDLRRLLRLLCTFTHFLSFGCEWLFELTIFVFDSQERFGHRLWRFKLVMKQRSGMLSAVFGGR